MWPFGGSRALAYFADPKKNEDYDEEEAHHLLGNVIDSDDEQAQADALSPDQIKRFLDASKSSRASSSSTSWQREVRTAPGAGDQTGLTSRSAACAKPTARSASTSAPGEYDELFDEELEDEPENVGAKFRYLAKSSAADDSFSPVETDGRGLGFGGAKPRADAQNAMAVGTLANQLKGNSSLLYEEDDEDEDEVAGPMILPSSPPAFLPNLGTGHGAGASFDTAFRAPRSEAVPPPASKDVNVLPAPLLASPVSWDAASSIVLEGDSEGSFIKEVPEATAVAG